MRMSREYVHARLSKCRKACHSVDMLCLVNAFDEKYLNCHCAWMMLTKSLNILPQEMHCAYLVILAPFSKGSYWKHFISACSVAEGLLWAANWVLSAVKIGCAQIPFPPVDICFNVDWEHYLTQASWVIGYFLHREFNGSRSRYKAPSSLLT